jgi:hypothetical protein
MTDHPKTSGQAVRDASFEIDSFSLLNDSHADAIAQAAIQASGLVEALVDTTAHLAAAISLLERSPKVAASSDKMFDQMLNDYRLSLERSRSVLAKLKGQGNG